jgi:hypothetical protein
MNREDIIKLAREANIKQAIETPHLLFVHELERFAALAVAAERDRMCEQSGISKELAHEKAKSHETN